MSRIPKPEYYWQLARQVAVRGTCLRRNYGAVIVKDDIIISTGYTGSPRGTPNCNDGQRKCKRQELGCAPGERYELCRSVHAEMNAIICAERRAMLGSTIYVAGFNEQTGDNQFDIPCLLCQKMILNAGIAFVCYDPCIGLLRCDARFSI